MLGVAVAELRPQAGPQEKFLSSPADIAIFGGGAFSGKTYTLLMEPLRHINNPNFGAVYFRRTMPMITAEGGGWDTACQIYGGNARTIQSPQLIQRFASGARVSFHQLQYDDTVRDWDSSQIPLILFDELQQFSRRQFFYMLSRNRSTCGVEGYTRCACNPDPYSWLRVFLAWWIGDPGCPECADGSCRRIEHGLPNPERSGRIRWFVTIGDKTEWADSKAELVQRFGEDVLPLSVTYVAATALDNRIGLAKDRGYLAKLNALPRWERERLLGGNWNARPVAGTIFARSDFEIVDAVPCAEREIRYWDRAATEPSDANPDPDWTAGVRIMRGTDGLFYITDVVRFRERPFGVKKTVKNTASQDGVGCSIGIEQDPGSAGVSEADDFVLALAGYDVTTYPARGAKVVRWKPLSAQTQAGNVKLLRGAWNEDFISELCALTDTPSEYGHDDQADAAAGGFNALTQIPVADPEIGSILAARRARG